MVGPRVEEAWILESPRGSELPTDQELLLGLFHEENVNVH